MEPNRGRTRGPRGPKMKLSDLQMNMLEPCSCHLHSHHRHHRCHLQCHHPQRPGATRRRPGHAKDPSPVVAEGSNNHSAVLTKNVQFHSKREIAKTPQKSNHGDSRHLTLLIYVISFRFGHFPSDPMMYGW